MPVPVIPDVPIGTANESFLFQNIPTATTGAVVVKSGSGTLHCIVINNSLTGTITVYDNTAASGTVIATITNPTKGLSFFYDVVFNTGLTVNVSATGGDYTVTYR